MLLAVDTATEEEVAIKRVFHRPPERTIAAAADRAPPPPSPSAPLPPLAVPLPPSLPAPVRREAEALLRVPPHPNVVRLRDVFVGGGGGASGRSPMLVSPRFSGSPPPGDDDGHESPSASPHRGGGTAHLVLDYCDARDLSRLLDACGDQQGGEAGPLPLSIAKALALQLLLGLAHCHDGGGVGGEGEGEGGVSGEKNNSTVGVAHGDVKPGNLLLCGRTGKLKLADFGQAVFVGGGGAERRRVGATADENDDDPHDDAAPEGALPTRWYRPPEVLYGARRYSARAADVWAAGCVVAELYGLQPVLPGRGDLGQLACTVRALGTVDLSSWPEAASLPDWDKVSFAPCVGKSLAELVPAMPKDAAALVARMMAVAPRERATARQALADAFFGEGALPAPASDACVARFVRETLAAHDLRMGRLKALPVMMMAMGGAIGGGAPAAALTLPPEDEEEG